MSWCPEVIMLDFDGRFPLTNASGVINIMVGFSETTTAIKEPIQSLATSQIFLLDNQVAWCIGGYNKSKEIKLQKTTNAEKKYQSVKKRVAFVFEKL
ncbi:hypothetical protein GDO81_001534 [Engystomops pustulosus]|uniref:Uncharacterized protein n=1 Tax=Engystomops pustulosus TaxID=76066 RepID=A0AAV7DEQ0_ENGPU|nr:hypothetical protein GDO81_001534 [Engystomops pustulosus]